MQQTTMSSTTSSNVAVVSSPSTLPSPGVKPKLHKKDIVLKQVAYPFWFGGSASSMAACVTHPLDLVKVRMQLRAGDGPKNMSGTIIHIVRASGPRGLYDGLTASLLRQMTYSTVRFGVYEDLKRRFTPDGQKPTLPLLIGLSSLSGFLGGLSGNAADVVNVRMQQEAVQPASHKRHYRNGLDGMIKMARQEGLFSWYRGVLPNATRAALMNASQLASYDSIKVALMTYTPLGDTTTTHFTSSLFAGFIATTICSPVDVIKSRVMSAHTNKSLLSFIAEIYAKEGVSWMFKGWVPAFLRLGPQTICTFMFLEAHRKAYRNIKGIEE
ncbi:hypothetical protein E0Z10_g5622 [Xylaria hypoxylon]|uniref:Mitochondrial dicarboxylate carrier n=1 Tax=Xylaria hypoxylon TaxID=37992 RepID=A0A4Z0YUQ0_9PEZI|nr:hypothetical protein E0Z10_g5622 [Xylaria hypoxylon]